MNHLTTQFPYSSGYKSPSVSPVSSIQLHLPPQRASQPQCSGKPKTLPSASPTTITASDDHDLLVGTIISRVAEFLKAQLYCNLILPNVSAQTATQVIQYFNSPTNVRTTYPDLPAKSLEKFRYSYDFSATTLAIRGMPTNSHDTLAEFFASLQYFAQLLQNGPFTPAEYLCIKPWLSNVALPGPSKRTHDGSNPTGLGPREKIADYAFVYAAQGANERLPVFPHVVVEVAFSQEYSSVLADVQEWVVATKGGVKAAVLFKIEEGKVPGKRVEQLEGMEGVGGDDEVVAVEEEGRGMQEQQQQQRDVSPGPEDYARRLDGIDVDNWVGKFTVFMETWVYDNTTGGASRQQQRQYLMNDNILASPMPRLTFTRSTFGLPNAPGHNENQEFNIDLTPYANNLLQSRLHDAFRRKTRWLSRCREKRRREEGDHSQDGDFVAKRAGVEGASAGLAEPSEENAGAVGEGSECKTRERGVKRFKSN